jgi:hypothetical protein
MVLPPLLVLALLSARDMPAVLAGSLPGLLLVGSLSSSNLQETKRSCCNLC